MTTNDQLTPRVIWIPETKQPTPTALHEIAHLYARAGHSPEWRDTFRSLLTEHGHKAPEKITSYTGGMSALTDGFMLHRSYYGDVEGDTKYIRTAATDPTVDGILVNCTKCGEPKKTDELTRNKNRRTGFNPWCKECQKAYGKTYNNQKRLERKLVEAGGVVVGE